MTLPKKNQTLSGRHRYFQIFIFLGFIAPTAIRIQGLTTLMSVIEFISQTRIERILDKFQIPDRGRLIGIEKFHGQLEKEEKSGLPYWNIYIITQHLTTRKRLLDALLKKLQLTQDKTIKTAISTVEVHSVSAFHELHEGNRFRFPNTVWYPGFFSDQTVLFDKLLTNDDVEEVIKTYPEKYKKMLKDVLR